MALLPVKVHTSEIKLGLAFMVPHLVYKLQVICLRGTYGIEWKPNVELAYVQTDMGNTYLP
jgi:hypothetical protein